MRPLLPWQPIVDHVALIDDVCCPVRFPSAISSQRIEIEARNKILEGGFRGRVIQRSHCHAPPVTMEAIVDHVALIHDGCRPVRFPSAISQPDILSPPLLRLTCRKPFCVDLQPVHIKSRWRHNWKSAHVVISHLVCDPRIQQVGFDVPRQQ